MSEYDTDVLHWSEHQSALLRQHALHVRQNDPAIDWPNIIEEIESVGRSERSALTSHVKTIIEHLLKLDVSPAAAPRAGWTETILRARSDIEDVLESSPSLRPALGDVVSKQMPRARRLAVDALALHGEAPRLPVDRISYSVDQVIGRWLPNDAN